MRALGYHSRRLVHLNGRKLTLRSTGSGLLLPERALQYVMASSIRNMSTVLDLQDAHSGTDSNKKSNFL